MKIKVVVSAAALAFATLPSCTSTGGIDPGFALLAGELGDGYLQYEQQRAEQEAAQYQRFLEAQAARQQAATAQMPMQPVPPFMAMPPETTIY